MRAKCCSKPCLLLLVVYAVVVRPGTFNCSARVLDDFNDNVKTAWADFTFVPGFGIPVETNGQFRFELPPAGRAIFTASQKTSRVFEIQEGERLEFSADIEQAGGKDSFAV